MRSIIRTELLETPEKFGVNLGKAPLSQIMLYENAGLIPPCITIGGSGRGNPRKGYYPEMILNMMRDIRILQSEHKFPGIRNILDKKYRRVFELMDVIELFRVRYLGQDLLMTYLDRSSLTIPQKRRIMELFEKNLPYKKVKLEILDMLSGINIKSEVHG